MDQKKYKNVVKLPITHSQRYRNQLGKIAAPCRVSGRWLRFGETSNFVGNGEVLTLDVMTRDAEDNPKKVCSLMVDRGELLKALEQIKPRAQSSR